MIKYVVHRNYVFLHHAVLTLRNDFLSNTTLIVGLLIKQYSSSLYMFWYKVAFTDFLKLQM